MSLAQRIDPYVKSGLNRKHGNYGFIVALLGIAVALVIASATSSVSIGKGIDDVNTFVGP